MKKNLAIGLGLGLGAALLLATRVGATETEKAAFITTIIDDRTELPINGAVVTLNGNTCMSDYSGNCRIPDLEPGFHRGMVSKVGYNNYYL